MPETPSILYWGQGHNLIMPLWLLLWPPSTLALRCWIGSLALEESPAPHKSQGLIPLRCHQRCWGGGQSPLEFKFPLCFWPSSLLVKLNRLEMKALRIQVFSLPFFWCLSAHLTMMSFLLKVCVNSGKAALSSCSASWNFHLINLSSYFSWTCWKVSSTFFTWSCLHPREQQHLKVPSTVGWLRTWLLFHLTRNGWQHYRFSNDHHSFCALLHLSPSQTG